METIEVTVVNWSRYNPRKEQKSGSWFRFEHAFFEEPKFYDFTTTERLAWVYILCCASKEYKDKVTLYFGHAERFGGIKRDDFYNALQKMKQVGVILMTGTQPPASVPVRADECTTNERTNVRTNVQSSGKPNDALDVLVAMWNLNAPKECARVKSIKDRSRMQLLRSALTHTADMSYWKQVIQLMHKSKFIRGLEGDRSAWGIDSMLRNHVRIMEGQYGINQGMSAGNSGAFAGLSKPVREDDGQKGSQPLLGSDFKPNGQADSWGNRKGST